MLSTLELRKNKNIKMATPLLDSPILHCKSKIFISDIYSFIAQSLNQTFSCRIKHSIKLIFKWKKCATNTKTKSKEYALTKIVRKEHFVFYVSIHTEVLSKALWSKHQNRILSLNLLLIKLLIPIFCRRNRVLKIKWWPNRLCLSRNIFLSWKNNLTSFLRLWKRRPFRNYIQMRQRTSKLSKELELVKIMSMFPTKYSEYWCKFTRELLSLRFSKTQKEEKQNKPIISLQNCMMRWMIWWKKEISDWEPNCQILDK